MSTKHLLMQEPIFFLLNAKVMVAMEPHSSCYDPLVMGLHLLLMALQVMGDSLLHLTITKILFVNQSENYSPGMIYAV